VVNAAWDQPVLVVGVGLYGKRVGRLDLQFDDFGVITGYSGAAVQMGPAITADPTLQAVLVDYYNRLVNNSGAQVGTSSVALTADQKCMFGECVLGNWATDVLRKTGGTQIGLMNGGALGGNGLPQGTITLGDFVLGLPFGSNLRSTFSIQGQYLVEALEWGVQKANDTNLTVADGIGRFLQVAGLRFSWNKDEPLGLRVVDVDVEVTPGVWQTLDPQAIYNVTCFDFLRKGGDGHTELTINSFNVNDFGPTSDKLFLDYLSLNSPVSAQLEGRINLTTLARSDCIGPDGTICTSRGTCKGGLCTCNPGSTGTTCELDEVSSSSSSQTLAIVLGTVLPVVFLIVLLLVVVTALIFFIVWRITRREEEEWNVDHDEIEFGERLGAGAFGEVFKGSWKGTEVAIKVMHTGNVSKEMKNNFIEEMRVMNTLRHPNVVLFMGASSKPPKMCILMEFMTLGSLHEVLHNELISSIPHALQLKIALGAAKGMHFLHSSGIVHRDLKSLNLLLDDKWNVKVSDFGLTKFKEHIKREDTLPGSIHWTAPEILGEADEVDFDLADVYSYGIILWELLTREDPYAGMSTAAVAVAVLRDGLRPEVPDYAPDDYVQLMSNCWDQDPQQRPAFLEIMTRLESMIGESTTSSQYSSRAGSMSDLGSPSTLNSMTDEDGGTAIGAAVGGGVAPPDGDIVLVITDIVKAAALWEFNATAMRDATLLHNDLIRSEIKKHGGYEAALIRNGATGEGSFCVAFQDVKSAVEWCMDVQHELLKVEWPEALLAHPSAAEEIGDVEDKVLFKGLRVRMGLHYGKPKAVKDPVSRRIEYIGPVINSTARITSMAHGGQILMSQEIKKQLKDTKLMQEKDRVVFYGKLDVPNKKEAKLYELKIRGLEGRFFGGIDDLDVKKGKGKGKDKDGGDGGSTHSVDSNADMIEMRSFNSSENAAEPVMSEESFLTSANLCRWIIDFKQLQMGKEIGTGTFGTVYRGKWKGVDVAVKRFINQKMTEKVMLNFRAEVAFLSELNHPNVVLFIGACVKRPNLCVVTEYVKQGSLRSILSNNTIKLRWQQKLMMLRGAAMGIHYLHTLTPSLIHRDLKSDNLLVDENWTLKIADFGFARIKEENMTMTRCGTPCWTAPEVIRGEKYNEKADVYGFGIIMWEVLTRKIPYEGRNFMNMTLDVLEGRRPQIPLDCPVAYKKLMKSCWHAKAAKRPSMEKVLEYFDSELADDVVNNAV